MAIFSEHATSYNGVIKILSDSQYIINFSVTLDTYIIVVKSKDTNDIKLFITFNNLSFTHHDLKFGTTKYFELDNLYDIFKHQLNWDVPQHIKDYIEGFWLMIKLIGA